MDATINVKYFMENFLTSAAESRANKETKIELYLPNVHTYKYNK